MKYGSKRKMRKSLQAFVETGGRIARPRKIVQDQSKHYNLLGIRIVEQGVTPPSCIVHEYYTTCLPVKVLLVIPSLIKNTRYALNPFIDFVSLRPKSPALCGSSHAIFPDIKTRSSARFYWL
jgi:hypothetical protein